MSQAAGFDQDDKYVGWENLMALNVMRLYLNKMQYKKVSNDGFEDKA